MSRYQDWNAPPPPDWPDSGEDQEAAPAEGVRTIRGSAADWHRSSADEACGYLAELPELFLDRERSMLWVDDAPHGSPRLRYVEPTTVPDLLGRANVACQHLIPNGQDEGGRRFKWSWTPIPAVLCQTVISRRPQHVPWKRFEGFASGPYLLLDGALVEAHGFASARGLWLPHVGLAALKHSGKGAVKAHGFQAIDDGRAALDWVVRELREFPWADPEMGPAVWLGYLMTLITRPAYEHAPLFLFEASRPRSGKDLLFKCAEVVAHGRTAYRITLVEQGEENEKRIATGLLAGHTTLIFGDVKHLGSPLLLSLITEGQNNVIRLLGTNTTIPVPPTLTMGASANNVTFNVPDLIPRTIALRLDPPTSTPENTPHSLDQHELVQHFARHRPAMLAAVINAIRGYLHRKPDPETDPKGIPCGSFPQWAQMVRDPLVYYGFPDLLETQAQLRKQVPVGEQGAIEALFAAWWSLIGEQGITSGRLLQMAANTESSRERDDGGYETITDPRKAALADAIGGLFDQKPSPRRLTKILKGQRDALISLDDVRVKLHTSVIHGTETFNLRRIG